MPLEGYGDLARHIGLVFGAEKGTWGLLADQEAKIVSLLQVLKDESVDDLSFSMAGIPYADPTNAGLGRDSLVDERMRTLGFDEVFKSMNIDESATSGPFRVFRAPDDVNRGYGSFALPRQYFIDAIAAGDAERIQAGLSYTMPSFQIDKYETGASRYRLSGKVFRREFIESTAQQLAGEGFDPTRTRLVFDVESAGLQKHDGIWQLSARLMRGDEQVGDPANIIIKNPAMDRGLYEWSDASGTVRKGTFEQFYAATRGGAEEFLDFEQGMRQFFEMVDQADYLVGQNIQFDIGMIEYGLKTDEMKEAGARFMEMVKSGKMLDTMALSNMVFNESIQIADELTAIGKHTPLSMENILLQTSFLDDLMADVGVDEVQRRLVTGVHYGDVDTWFEDHLLRLQLRALSGEDILKTTPLSRDLTVTLPDGTAVALRDLISRASAITPITKLPGTGTTPLQNLLRDTRTFGSDGTVRRVTESQLYERGIYSSLVDKYITKSGKLRARTGFLDPTFAAIEGVFDATDTVQARALAANLPFAGLSLPERLLSTLLGQASGRGVPHRVESARSGLFGEFSGGLFEKTRKARGFRRGNVALPVEIIQAAERANIVDTHFGDALSGDINRMKLQTTRLSTIKGISDIAQVADIFQDDDSAKRFAEWFKGLADMSDADLLEIGLTREQLTGFGITSDNVGELSSKIARFGKELGIQIGIIGSKKKTGGIVPSVGRLYEAITSLGYGTDKPDSPSLRVAVYSPTQGTVAKHGDLVDYAMTSPIMIDDGTLLDQHAEAILQETKRSAQMDELILTEAEGNRYLQTALKLARGRSDKAKNIHRFLIDHGTGIKRGLVGALAAGVGYYALKKDNEQDFYDQTLAPQGYEEPGFYGEYKQSMGEVAPRNSTGIPRALSTAGLVQDLDRNKTRHHQMGPGKYNHLYGG